MTNSNNALQPQAGNLAKQNHLAENARIFSKDNNFVLVYKIENGQHHASDAQFVKTEEFMGVYGGNLATKEDFKEFKSEIKSEMREFKSEIRAEIAEMKSEIKDFKLEVKAEIAEMKREIKDFKLEVKAEIADIKNDIKEFKAETNRNFEAIDRKMSRIGYVINFLVALSIAIPIINSAIGK